MIITVECPSCNTTFPVDPRKVPAGGVKVRCSACSGIFFVEEPDPIAAPPPLAAPIPPVQAERRAPAEVPVDEDRAHVDPWSGSGFDHHEAMGDAGHGEGPSDPWSGGVGLDEAAGSFAAAEADDSEEPPQLHETHPAHGDATDDDVWTAEVDEATEGAGDDGLHEASGDDWMLEPRREVDFGAPDAGVERMETVEEQVRAAAAEMTGDEVSDDAENPWDADVVPPAAEAPVEAAMEATLDAGDEVWHDGAAEFDSPEGEEPEVAAWDREEADEGEDPVEAAWEEAAAEADVVGAESEAEVEEAAEAATEFEAEVADAAAEFEAEVESGLQPAPPAGFQFGRRDPHEKARRLARVLVSDMITYNPDRHRRALERGTLHADFEEEIRKSWAEYTEQVGRELAESTTYWFDALNEILARGEKVF